MDPQQWTGIDAKAEPCLSCSNEERVSTIFITQKPTLTFTPTQTQTRTEFPTTSPTLTYQQNPNTLEAVVVVLL